MARRCPGSPRKFPSPTTVQLIACASCLDDCAEYIDNLREPKPDVDPLTLEEAERLPAAAPGQDRGTAETQRKKARAEQKSEIFGERLISRRIASIPNRSTATASG